MKKITRPSTIFLLLSALALLLTACAVPDHSGVLIPVSGKGEETPIPQLQLPPRPPQGVESPRAEAMIGPQSVLNLPSMKAVLIVGPIDGDTGSWTLDEIANMRLAENVLKANGVTVFTFYTPNNDWNQIKAAASGAQFLLYRGHGINWGGSPIKVGGFALKNGLYSSETIRSDLKLAQNAIVMLYACYTTGSAGGEYNLNSAEAQRRVAMYASPFMDNGAAGYYANWFGSAFSSLLQYLFQGQTLGQAYQSYFDYKAAGVERYVFPTHPELAMWLDKDDWGSGSVYDYAFAGKANDTLQSLFGTSMVAAPQPVNYMAQAGSPVHQEALHVDGTSSLQFTWNAFLPADPSWVRLSTSTGINGTATTLVLNPTGLAKGTYTTDLRITSSTPGVLNNDQVVKVTLMVVQFDHYIYMPVTQK